MEATKSIIRERKAYGISPEPPEVSLTGRYTITAAAEKLRLSRNTITRYYQSGELRPIDPGARRLRFSGKELTRFWNWMTKR